MIINLIIKHLLPAAPALSILCGPPGIPVTGEGRGRGREKEERASEREAGGARGRGWTEPRGESKRGHHHIAGFFHTSDRQCVCVCVDFVLECLSVCEVM